MHGDVDGLIKSGYLVANNQGRVSVSGTKQHIPGRMEMDQEFATQQPLLRVDDRRKAQLFDPMGPQMTSQRPEEDGDHF